jgi:hypothetical protein
VPPRSVDFPGSIAAGRESVERHRHDCRLRVRRATQNGEERLAVGDPFVAVGLEAAPDRLLHHVGQVGRGARGTRPGARSRASNRFDGENALRPSRARRGGSRD